MQTETKPTKDRPAHEPGGCECMTCGAIFVGAAHHTECGICYDEASEAYEAYGEKQLPGASGPRLPDTW